jgi:cob(I)alamin adenosyltransferase
VRVAGDQTGLVIVHTGPGEGKTTAALGTAFRAVGQGLKVLMVQFIKGSWHYGELDGAKILGDDRFQILPMGRGFVKVGVEKPDREDVRLVQDAWNFASAKVMSGEYDLVILRKSTTQSATKCWTRKKWQKSSNEGRKWCMSF